MIKGSSPCRNKRQRLQGCGRTLWKFGRRNGKMGLTGPDGPVSPIRPTRLPFISSLFSSWCQQRVRLPSLPSRLSDRRLAAAAFCIPPGSAESPQPFSTSCQTAGCSPANRVGSNRPIRGRLSAVSSASACCSRGLWQGCGSASFPMRQTRVSHLRNIPRTWPA